MLSSDDRCRVAVVLVRARNPQNVGAVARAMHDFGFADLRVVSDYPMPLESARSAVDAGEVIRAAQTLATLTEAIADATLVLGTPALGERALEHPVWPVGEAAERITAHLAAHAGHRVALLFGSEKTGLSNEELSQCHALLTIPMQQHPGVRHPSMNLGQAAAVCLYELQRGRSPARLPEAQPAAVAADLERLRTVIAEVLEISGYTERYSVPADDPRLRRQLLRAGIEQRDVTVWMGVWRQILWRLRQIATADTPRTDPPAQDR